ncbi:cytochrome P450 [Pseudofrankia asymbiotica]|nr:cytochrome P450 [Pseudofrankia asymbiotica]
MTTQPSSEAAEPIEAVAARFEVHDPALQHDPHPVYARLRAERPVAHSDMHGGHHILSRYDDVLAVLQDPARFSSSGVLIPSWEFPVGGPQIPLEIDGEDHRLYRVALASLFSPAQIAPLEPLMRTTARRLLAAISAKGGGEMISEYASPLAAETFLHTFDMTRDVLPDLLAYKDLLIRGGGERRDDLAAGSPAIVGLFQEQLERRRAEGATGPDAMSQLLRARFAGRPLTDDEIVNISVVIMLASLDTTSAALGNILAFLVNHPDHRRQLTQDPALIPGAVEELLRYEGMISNGRLVTEKATVGGVELSPGERVMLLYASTGRDERKYDDPETVQFERANIRHLTFGAGPHRCLGMHLARLTLRVGIEELHGVTTDYRLAPGSEPEWALGHVRGLLSLELTF